MMETLKPMRPAVTGFGGIGLRINWLACAVFVCGIASARVVNLIGEIYLGEILLIQLAFLMFVAGQNRSLFALPAFGTFVQMAIVMLLGYVLSDLYRDTHPALYLRGWSRVILLTLDFMALAVMVAHDKRNLWWFVLGIAVGSLVQLLVRHVPIDNPADWKFGYSTPLAYLLACLSCILPIRFASIAFVLFGVFNIYKDFRILGAICLLIAGILWIRSDLQQAPLRRKMARYVVASVVMMAILVGALSFTQEDFSARREQSNTGRTVGLVVATRGIIESPVIGYGSWPTDSRLVNLYQQEIFEASRGENKVDVNARVFTAHSQVLQGWIEGGALGLLFWLIYGVGLVGAGVHTVFRRPVDAYFPVFLFFIFYNFWALLMSPFSGPTRIPIAVGIAVICLCALERRRSRVGG